MEKKPGIFSRFVETHDGYNFCPEYTPNRDVKQHLEDINSLTFSEDEVVIASYSKSGSHWMYDIVNMLTTGKLDYTTKSITSYALDFLTLEALRKRDFKVFGSHFYPRFFPKDFMEKRNKIIYIYRNPKDVAVSYLEFVSKMNISDIPSDMDLFLDEYLSGEVFCGKWLDHVREWEKYKLEHPYHPVLMIAYEELKENFPKGVQRVSDFLELNHPQSFIEDVVEKCQFDNMSSYKHKHIPDSAKAITKDSLKDDTNIFFNKGIVGNWKNVLTVRQSERIDEEFAEAIKELQSTIKFTL